MPRWLAADRISCIPGERSQVNDVQVKKKYQGERPSIPYWTSDTK